MLGITTLQGQGTTVTAVQLVTFLTQDRMHVNLVKRSVHDYRVLSLHVTAHQSGCYVLEIFCRFNNNNDNNSLTIPTLLKNFNIDNDIDNS